MKHFIKILEIFFFLTGLTAYGQTLTLEIDSLTSNIFKKNVYKNQDEFAFQYIIEQRKKNHLHEHLDTTLGDYVFIVEYFCFQDTSSTTKEEYFMQGDSIPNVIYLDDTIHEVEKLYASILGRERQRIKDEELFNPKLTRFKTFKNYQELSYDKVQTRVHGCVDYDSKGKRFKKIRAKQLKGSYAIYTFINHKTGEIRMSFQYAPKKPRFKIDTYNPVWDW